MLANLACQFRIDWARRNSDKHSNFDFNSTFISSTWRRCGVSDLSGLSTMESAENGYRPASFFSSASGRTGSALTSGAVQALPCTESHPDTPMFPQRSNCQMCRHLVNDEEAGKYFHHRKSRGGEQMAGVKSHGSSLRIPNPARFVPRQSHCAGDCLYGSTMSSNLDDTYIGSDSAGGGSASVRCEARHSHDGNARTLELLRQSPRNTIWLTECPQNQLQMSFEPPVVQISPQSLPNQPEYLSTSHSTHSGIERCSSQCHYLPTRCERGTCSLPLPYFPHHDRVNTRTISPPSRHAHLTNHSSNSHRKHRLNSPQIQRSIPEPSCKHQRFESPSFEEGYNSSMEVPDTVLGSRQSWSRPGSGRSSTSKGSEDSFCSQNLKSPQAHSKGHLPHCGESAVAIPGHLSGSDLSVAHYKRHLYRSISAPQSTPSTGHSLRQASFPIHCIRDTRASSHCNSQDSAFVSESHFGDDTSAGLFVSSGGGSVPSALHSQSEYPDHSLYSNCRKTASIDEQLRKLFSDSDFIKKHSNKVISSNKSVCTRLDFPADSSSRKANSRRKYHPKSRHNAPRSFSDNSIHQHDAKKRSSTAASPGSQMKSMSSGRIVSTCISPEEARDRRKRLDIAYAEFELLFEQLSVRLEDDELLDRAERRDLPTQHQLLWRSRSEDAPINQTSPDISIKSGNIQLWTPSKVAAKVHKCQDNDFFFRKVSSPSNACKVDLKDIVFRSGSYMLMSPAHSKVSDKTDQYSDLPGDPDVVADDVALRKHQLANSTHVLEHQPPFGIPLSVHLPLSTSSSYLSSPVPGKGTRRQSSFRPRPTVDVVLDDLAYRALRRDGDDYSPCRSLSPPRSRLHTPNIASVRSQRGLDAGCGTGVNRGDVIAASRRSNACSSIRCVCGEHDISDSELEISDAVKLSMCHSFKCRSHHSPSQSKPGALYTLFVEGNEMNISGLKSTSSACSTGNSHCCSSSRSRRPFYDSFSSPLKCQLRFSPSLENICSEVCADGRRFLSRSLPNCNFSEDDSEVVNDQISLSATNICTNKVGGAIDSSPHSRLHVKNSSDSLLPSSVHKSLVSSRCRDGVIISDPVLSSRGSDCSLPLTGNGDFITSQSFMEGRCESRCESAGIGQCSSDSLVEFNFSVFEGHSSKSTRAPSVNAEECDNDHLTSRTSSQQHFLPLRSSKKNSDYYDGCALVQDHGDSTGSRPAEEDPTLPASSAYPRDWKTGSRTSKYADHSRRDPSASGEGCASGPGEMGIKQNEWVTSTLMAVSLLQLVVGSAGLLPLVWLLALALAVFVSLTL